MRILQAINGHEDLKKLTKEERVELCCEIRQFLIDRVSKTGGHLASNLGVVELTVAMETVFDTKKDRLVFDVGHQSYVHKLLTGRRAEFSALRQFGGMAGFPKPSESETDAFVAGHASSSVSIALGMARARTLQKQDYRVAALIGDGASTGGMAYEGLNDAAVSGEPMVVVLNDNAMSIDQNVGGMARHLSKVRTKAKYLNAKQRYRSLMEKFPGGMAVYNWSSRVKKRIRKLLIPATIFENMGMRYIGPVDGHNLEDLIAALRSAADMQRPVLVHVLTQKGRGYGPAEENPSRYHGVGAFDPETGSVRGGAKETFSETFGKSVCALAETDPRICAITAAMPAGTGLLPFKKQFPKRLFDVGIAEEHAVSMAGGLAKQGMIPIVALYSTFLQRGYDQILQDIAMLGLHVILAVDRAGLVGEDGETHHGIFDVGFLRQIPGMKILCPASCAELSDMLTWAVRDAKGPVAVRYPRGGDAGYTASAWQGPAATVACHQGGEDVTILTYGTLVNQAMVAAGILKDRGIQAGVLRLLSLGQEDISLVTEKLSKTHCIIVLEETKSGCGIRQDVCWQLRKLAAGCRVEGIDLGEGFVTHGSVDTLYRHYGLVGQSVASYILEVLGSEDQKAP